VLCSLALSLSSFPVARGIGVPPTTHPTSSCSWGWAAGGVSFFVAACWHRHSTCDPPHEQLLVRLGGGWCVVCQLVLVLGSLLVVVGGKKHHYPPHEQWLAGLEVGALLFLAAGGVGCFLSRG